MVIQHWAEGRVLRGVRAAFSRCSLWWDGRQYTLQNLVVLQRSEVKVALE